MTLEQKATRVQYCESQLNEAKAVHDKALADEVLRQLKKCTNSSTEIQLTVSDFTALRKWHFCKLQCLPQLEFERTGIIARYKNVKLRISPR